MKDWQRKRFIKRARMLIGKTVVFTDDKYGVRFKVAAMTPRGLVFIDGLLLARDPFSFEIAREAPPSPTLQRALGGGER